MNPEFGLVTLVDERGVVPLIVLNDVEAIMLADLRHAPSASSTGS